MTTTQADRILVGIRDFTTSTVLADPNSYNWKQSIRVQSSPGTDSAYCEDATVCLRKLGEIHDQNDIVAAVDDLLGLERS